MARELINVEAVDRSFGAVDVLRDINIKVNGAGKTTLLNTISEQKQDTGDIDFAPGIRLAYLTQIRDLESDSTIEEELGRKGRQFQELEEEIAAIEAQMVDPAFYEGDWEPVMEHYAELQQTLASSGGGNVAGIAKGILERLGLDKHPMEMAVNKLSGGEQAKLALARQLVGLNGIDVMFLDEPTNHLDIHTTEWLETFLTEFKGAQLIVSHDRYFLDQVCNRIVEIDNLRAWPWKGNYSQFLVQKTASEKSLGDRIGIVGGNGQGKTTLLKLINGDERLTSGTMDLAPGCEIGYFHQDHATLDFDLNPIEQIQKLRPDFQYGDIRAALGRFQFSSEQVSTKLSQLSGGERARVALLKLLLEENNLLLMDEPTNHLDMDSKDTLEEALVGYTGSLITVSHDRWFLDQVVNRIWELQDGVVTVYYGNYTDYVRAKKGLPPLADGEISEV